MSHSYARDERELLTRRQIELSRTPQSAVEELRAALSLNPADAETARDLVCAFERLGLREDAVPAWVHLGDALEKLDRLEEARTAYSEVLSRKPDCLKALVGLGDVSIRLGRPDDAGRYYEAAIALDSTDPHAHIRLGWVYHLTGRSERGWDELAWMFKGARAKWRRFEQPVWDGAPIQGRRVLLWMTAGAGLGDTIHLARYAEHAKNRGARVIVECQRDLVDLIKCVRTIDQVVPLGAPNPAFDLHAPLMWIPVVDRVARQFRYSVPYVSLDERLVENCRTRLPERRSMAVGLCWGGRVGRPDASVRFVSLNAFAPLAALPRVNYVSLQLGPPAAELVRAPEGLRIDRLLYETSSIINTAALLASLDLVITVDTMIAHLAGALGKPVWTLLPYAADWKWFTGDETPWYPTMRLFRQRRPGDWADVMKRVVSALESLPERGEAVSQEG